MTLGSDSLHIFDQTTTLADARSNWPFSESIGDLARSSCSAPGLFMITMSTHDYSEKHLFMSMITLKLIYS